MNKLIIIAGATASGKSLIAIELAKKLNTDVISADSMQIYKKMDIGTAKVTNMEAQGIRHRMIDIIEPDCAYSVAQYVDDCEKIIDSIVNSGKTPLICGGTGLYIDGLIYDYQFGVGKNDKLRAELSAEYDKDGGEKMYAEIMRLDPEDAIKFHRNNKLRLIRAMEIYLLSGKVKSKIGAVKQLKREVVLYVTDIERSILYNRIERRVDKMLENGLLCEIDSLINSGITFDMQSMQGIGYKEFADYYTKSIDLAQVIETIKQNTRNYAKRQITWFKKYEFAKHLSPSEIIDDVSDIYLK